MNPMTEEERNIQRKLKLLRHAEKTGQAFNRGIEMKATQ